MMYPIKSITSRDDAKQLMLEACQIVADVVGSTMGYRGRTVLAETDGYMPFPTKDGYHTLKQIFLENAVQHVTCEMIKEAAQKSVDEAGDGPQPLYSKVLTPYGFVTMGSLKEGDLVCGTNGTIQSVLGVFPKGKKEIYKVKFSDGRIVECCEDHLWRVSHKEKLSVMTTKSIIEKGLITHKTQVHKSFNNFVETTIVEFQETEKLEIDPYLLGLLLGDGSITGTGTIELSLGYNKKHILDKIILPEGMTFNVSNVERKNYLRVKFVGKDKKGRLLKNLLDDLNLLGLNSGQKFIPEKYLYSTIESRKKLLQGLIDTDGHINKRNLFEFSTISKRLYDDFISLCRGLNIPTCNRTHKRKPNSSYSSTDILRVTQLMGYKNGIKIIDIEKTGVFTEMQCIKVSNEDSLYITDDYVVTHNTTLTTILTNAFVQLSHKQLENGVSPIDVKNSIEKSKELIIAKLHSYARPLTNESIFDVAKTSANHDLLVAQIVADAYIKAGENGSVSHVRNNTDETVLVNIPGSLIEQGYSHEYYITNPIERTVFYDTEPMVLVSNVNFKSIKQLLPFLEFCNKNLKPLIIVSDLDFSIEAIIQRNRLEKNMPVAVITPPFNGQRRRDLLRDLATLCGTQVITLESGSYFESNFMDYLGSCKDVTISKRDTIITPNDNLKEVISGNIEELKKEMIATDINLEKKYIQERISRLSGGVSIIKVGGYTESERKELTDRVDDAVCAVRSAKEGGIVAGGGSALFHISNELELDAVSKGAIKEPLRRILTNAGVKQENIAGIFKGKDADIIYDHRYPFGYDVKDYELVDMFDKGVVDSVKVVVSALTNAISTATTILMVDHVITYAREDKKLNQ